MEFVRNELHLDGKWSSPGGEVKLFVCEYAIIKWYQGKKVLKLLGEKCEAIKQQFHAGIHEVAVKTMKH